MGYARSRSDAPRTIGPLRRDVDAAHADGPDVLPLAVRTGGANESDPWENTGAMPEHNVGDRVFQAVSVRHQRQADRTMLVVDACFHPGKPFGIEVGIGRRVQPPKNVMVTVYLTMELSQTFSLSCEKSRHGKAGRKAHDQRNRSRRRYSVVPGTSFGPVVYQDRGDPRRPERARSAAGAAEGRDPCDTSHL